MRAIRNLIPVVLMLGLGLPNIGHSQEIKTKFLPNGVTGKVGGYRPNRAAMDLEAVNAGIVPDGLEAPKFGKFEIGEKSWSFVLDEPKEAPAKLYIDTNGDGDLTNDPETVWEAKEQGEFKMYQGTGQIALDGENIGTLGLYRFDPNDESREALKNTMMFYLDFGYEYSFALDGKDLSTFVAGNLEEGGRLPIDRDGNGQVSSHFETATIGKPFNFTGTTFVFNLLDGALSLGKAGEELPQMQMPPNLKIGEPALTFSAETMDGTKIDFPGHYAGKIVMLDMWATWCGPCIDEIPHMKEAYGDWHDKGFEILGVTLDDEGMTEKVNEFLKEHEITWPQIYQGKSWEVDIAVQHDVSGIPFVLLIDGDSGKILANATQLRGEKLSEFIGEQLELKKGTSAGADSKKTDSGDGR